MQINFWYLILSVLEKLKNSIFEIPIIPQTLNINKWRTTSVKSINLNIIRKLVTFSWRRSESYRNHSWTPGPPSWKSLKTFSWRQCLLSPISRYCCLKVGRYYDPHSGFHEAKGLNLKIYKVENDFFPIMMNKTFQFFLCI